MSYDGLDAYIDHGEYTFVVPGRPRVKERPRHGRNGRVYTPRETLEREKMVAAVYGGPKFEGPVVVDVTFGQDNTSVTIIELDQEPTKLRGDIDNYVKLILDALNGVAWDDDRQVVILTAAKSY